MIWDIDVALQKQVLEEHAHNFIWPAAPKGYEWIDLDCVSAFADVLNDLGVFEDIDDVLIYLNSPGKFRTEYQAFYAAVQEYFQAEGVVT